MVSCVSSGSTIRLSSRIAANVWPHPAVDGAELGGVRWRRSGPEIALSSRAAFDACAAAVDQLSSSCGLLFVEERGAVPAVSRRLRSAAPTLRDHVRRSPTTSRLAGSGRLQQAMPGRPTKNDRRDRLRRQPHGAHRGARRAATRLAVSAPVPAPPTSSRRPTKRCCEEQIVACIAEGQAAAAAQKPAEDDEDEGAVIGRTAARTATRARLDRSPRRRRKP